jgi:hypothetical protein
MFIGHYSASFAGKALERRIPLWTLFVAAQLVDFVWAILVLAGVEKARVVPGLMAASALDLYYMPVTHSLVGAILWSVAGGFVLNFAVKARTLRTALVIGCAVLSHWFLDLIVHRPDLPLLGDDSMKLGLSMWNYFWPEFALEVLLLVIGIQWWLKTERKAGSSTPATVRAAWIIFGLLVICQCVDKFGPPPASSQMAAGSALAAYTVLAGFAAWADRTRKPA